MIEVSVAKVVRQFLIDVGVLFGPNAADWASVAGTMPASGADNFVSVEDTGAVQEGREHQFGERAEHPTVMFTIRTKDYHDGFNKGKAIQSKLDQIGVPPSRGGLGKPAVTVDGVRYRLKAAHVTIPVTKIGYEETKRRELFTLNAQLELTNAD